MCLQWRCLFLHYAIHTMSFATSGDSSSDDRENIDTYLVIISIISRVVGPLWGEDASHTGPVARNFGVFFDEQMVEQKIELQVICDTKTSMWRHCIESRSIHH